jgi:hypothetical protein
LRSRQRARGSPRRFSTKLLQNAEYCPLQTAVDLLRQACVAGYFDNPASVMRLKKDADLEPLRSRPDSLKLLTELAEKRESAAN